MVDRCVHCSLVWPVIEEMPEWEQQLEAILLLTPIWKYPISCSNYMYITLLSLPFTPSPMIPFSSLTLPPPLSPLHSPHSFVSLLQCLHIYSTLGMLHMSSR